MTLIYEPDLDILRMYQAYPVPKMKFVDFQKLEPEQDRQTDTQTHTKSERHIDRRDRTRYHAALAGGKIVYHPT